MEQLLLHLVGDYVTQTDWMAKKKFESFPPHCCMPASTRCPSS